MLYIYKYTNKINQKVYIGQTNNFVKRRNGHKSAALNPQSNDYNLPFHNAIRKYGWDNFDFEVLEEIDDSFGREYLDEREKFFIDFYKSLTIYGGYNVTTGGGGCSRPPKTFQEQVQCSKLFTEEDVRKIQQMLVDGYEYYEIQKVFPQLTDSFISNINIGQNFIRDDLTYPLSTLHTKFSKETKENIIQDIINNIPYKEISQKYGISTGYISMINSGQKWRDEKYTYPLCRKGCSNDSYVHDLKHDLIFTELTHEQIGKRYGKVKSTVTAINRGRNRKDSRFLYPLRANAKQNQDIWSTLF